MNIRNNILNLKNNKILLAMLPYWDPIIPPNGIAHLKGFLQKDGFEVKTVDVVVEEIFQKIYKKFFNALEECIPKSNRGNFFNIGHYMLQNLMMAHYNQDNEREYVELVKELIYKTYYINIRDIQAHDLINVLEEFYSKFEEYFIALLEKEKPAVVGLTAYKATLPASLFALQLTKKKFPYIKTLIGGGIFVDSHAIGTPNHKILLDYTQPFLDKLIVGQGELLFLEYLKGNLPDTKRVYTRDDIGGKILQLSEIGLPDFSDFDLTKYPYLVATASSSCPNQCSFCSSQWYYGPHRKKDPKQTAAEMVALHEKYGHQLFFMTDSLINTVVSDLTQELAQSPYSLYFDTYCRVDNASANIENTLAWRRGGLYRVRMGTESGSQKILDIMGKEITTHQTKASITALAHAGIKTTTYWVVGHPGETEEDFQATLNLIGELKNDIYQAEANPFHFHSTTQSGADQWSDKKMRLYSETAQKMLIFETWTAKIEPLREEVYQRLFRFDDFCTSVGIPNPYSLTEYMEAEKRWQKLHKFAVPSTIDFLDKTGDIKENKNIKNLALAGNMRQKVDNFDF